MTKETLEAMEACEPQANLYMAAEEYAEEQAYDFKGVCDVEDYKELAELMKQAVIYGAHWKEKQMMKDAVSCIVKSHPYFGLFIQVPDSFKCELGDEIRIIFNK